MNKWMLASVTLLLVGATAVPVQAQDQRRGDRESSAERADRSERGNRGERRESRGEDRREDRGDRQADGRRTPPVQTVEPRRPDGGGSYGGGRPTPAQVAIERNRQPVGQDRRGDRRDWRDDRRDDRGDRRDDRRDWRADRRDDRNDWRDDRRDDRRDWRDDRRDDRRDWRNDRRDYRYVRHNDRRWNGNYWYPQYRYRAPVRYVYPRGYRAYQWRVGHRLPSSYYHYDYYVDYNAYRLPPPPYGYHWVRVDRDVVLVSIATGLIRDILYGLYY